MGRRSINTTKSGKFMNPTDQARKEARKRELKKNKKQRMMVRQAVLKGKDPEKIIEDMEIIDKMEYNPMEPPKLNEKVLKDKRKKLKETFDRVMQMYEKEDPERSVELRKMYVEYERRQLEMKTYFDQVMSAQRVQLDAIPLPDAPVDIDFPSDIPLPGEIPLPNLLKQPKGILKSSNKLEGQTKPTTLPPLKQKPPGPPPGSPPPLSDSESEEEEEKKPAKQRRIRFHDDGALDPDEEEKDSRSKYKLAAKLLVSGETAPGVEDPEDDFMTRNEEDERDIEMDTDHHLPLSVPTGVPPPLPIRMHGMRGPGGGMLPIRLPPGPPPGRPPMLPPGPPPGMPPNLRMPPRMPPGLPPRLMRPPGAPPGIPPPGVPPQHQQSGTVLSAPPSIVKPPQRIPTEADEGKKTGATIQAKAQIKKLGDVTKFTPTALKVRREFKDAKGRIVKATEISSKAGAVPSGVTKASLQAPTKDDAYDTFMKEMEGLL